MKKRLATVLASLMLCLTVPLVFAGDSNTFKAGVARVDITPDTPVQMAGYANRKQLSEGVHDNLTARVLVFELQGSRLALVSIDIIGLHRGTAEPLREAILSRTGLKPAELFLSAIHTHAGPSLALGRGTGHPNNVRYTEILRRKLADLVANGLENLQPALAARKSGRTSAIPLSLCCRWTASRMAWLPATALRRRSSTG